jgi:hypothetical protein
MQKEPRVSLPFEDLTSDRVADIAYAHHLASIAKLAKTPVGQLAATIVQTFRQRCVAVDYCSTDGKYVFAILTIIVSLAKGISRRKQDLEDNLKAAKEQKDERVKKLNQAGRRFGLLKAGARSLLVGGFGFFITKTFLPWIDFERPIQPTYASLALALAFIIVSSVLRSWWTSHCFTSVFSMYDLAVFHAEEEYRRAALEEYERARRDAGLAWKRYTGLEPEEGLGYAAVLQEEEATRRRQNHVRQRMLANPIARVLYLCSSVLQSAKRRHKKVARKKASSKVVIDDKATEEVSI